MSTKSQIFESIKNIIEETRNTDDEQIFKEFVLYRNEQDIDQPNDRIHPYPYISLEFLTTYRTNALRFLQNIEQDIVIRIHIQSLDYNKLEIYDAVECVISILNWNENIKISDTENIQLTCSEEGALIKQEQEVIVPIKFTLNYKEKQCPYTKVYPSTDFDYLLRATSETEQFLPSDTGLNGTSWLDLSGTNGIIFE